MWVSSRFPPAILVTIVYWALLASPESVSTSYVGKQSPLFNSRITTNILTPFVLENPAYSNVAKHALNAVFALFEILLTNAGVLPWWDLPVAIVILGGYLGVAYITYETQGFYRKSKIPVSFPQLKTNLLLTRRFRSLLLPRPQEARQMARSVYRRYGRRLCGPLCDRLGCHGPS